ncbi:MAG: J domain-containing protein [Bacteroidota bacterium]|nr:J domain-containing protein [Bacteroidota bacterium]
MTRYQPFVNHYHTLGLPDFADARRIRVAYRQLAKQYHPDSIGTDAEVHRFNQINLAWQVLSQANEKSKFDTELRGRSTHIYAPSYDFGKTTRAAPGHFDDWLNEVRKPKPTTDTPIPRKSNKDLLMFWAKPIVLMLIALAFMYWIMH